MARIIDLPAAGALTGAEVIPVDDGAATKKATTSALAALVAQDQSFEDVIDAAAQVSADKVIVNQAKADAIAAAGNAAAAATNAISATEINLATALIQTQTIFVAHIAAGN